MISKETYDSLYLSTLLESMENKPVFVKAAFNYYKISRIIDVGDFVILETPEQNGTKALDDE